MPRPISAADATPVRVVIVTMDTHLASATDRARKMLASELPGLTIVLHAATEFSSDEDRLARCRADIASADIVLNAMLFMESHFTAILPDLKARAPECDAVVSILSDKDVNVLPERHIIAVTLPEKRLIHAGGGGQVSHCHFDHRRPDAQAGFIRKSLESLVDCQPRKSGLVVLQISGRLVIQNHRIIRA